MDEKNLTQVSEQFFEIIMQVHKKILKPDEFIKGFPIPPSHAKVIFYLAHKGASPVSSIAKELCISKPNMTPIIDKLLSDGYVSRYEDPCDRRVLRIEITEKAKEAFKLKKAFAITSLAEKLSELSDEDLVNLDMTLKTLNTLLIKLK